MRSRPLRAVPAVGRGSLLARHLVLLAFAGMTAAAPAAAVDLACGVPLNAHLQSGAADTYGFAFSTNAAVVVDAVDVSGSIGYTKLGAPGIGETCAGSLELRQSASTTVTVSDCIGNDAGDYTVVANVVSDVPQNCGRPLACGITPYVHTLTVPGQVDAYTFAGTQGEHVTITATDVDGGIGGVNLRLFDPAGTLLSGSDVCAALTNVALGSTGTYTVLASACGQPQAGRYGIGFQAPTCPGGPDITYFGVALADGTPKAPSTYDDYGRPVYQTNSTGFFTVIEARPGTDRAAPGFNAFDYDPSDPTVRPDLQVILSRPLGNGSAALCDKNGIPSVHPLDFADTAFVTEAINDFGCRVSDGTGQPQGVTNDDACTFFPNGDYHYVDPSSAVQFCTQVVPHTWRFPPGDTVVKARVRDTRDVLGAERSIIVRVAPPAAACPGDCNDDGEVTIDELIVAMTIVLELDGNTLAICPAADANADGVVTVDDIIRAVDAALGSCPT